MSPHIVEVLQFTRLLKSYSTALSAMQGVKSKPPTLHVKCRIVAACALHVQCSMAINEIAECAESSAVGPHVDEQQLHTQAPDAARALTSRRSWPRVLYFCRSPELSSNKHAPPRDPVHLQFASEGESRIYVQRCLWACWQCMQHEDGLNIACQAILQVRNVP